MDDHRALLHSRLDDLVRRHAAVQHHLRGADGRTEEAGADRAALLDHDEVLEALDAAGREEAAQIRAALTRLHDGTWDRCASCGSSIPHERLRALPYTTRCVRCAS